jgi:hypothetical protein
VFSCQHTDECIFLRKCNYPEPQHPQPPFEHLGGERKRESAERQRDRERRREQGPGQAPPTDLFVSLQIQPGPGGPYEPSWGPFLGFGGKLVMGASRSPTALDVHNFRPGHSTVTDLRRATCTHRDGVTARPWRPHYGPVAFCPRGRRFRHSGAKKTVATVEKKKLRKGRESRFRARHGAFLTRRFSPDAALGGHMKSCYGPSGMSDNGIKPAFLRCVRPAIIGGKCCNCALLCCTRRFCFLIPALNRQRSTDQQGDMTFFPLHCSTGVLCCFLGPRA